MSQLRRINSMPDPIHQQVAFVRRTELIELRNRRRELLKKVEAQATENASLRSDKAKVDAALAKFTASNDEFSVMRDHHFAEMRQLRDEVHSNNRRCQKIDHKIRAAEDGLHEMKDMLRRYRGLVDNEKLEGAETLAERLQENVDSIREKDLEIQNLRNEIESLTLSQQEEIKSEKLQNRQAKKQVHDLKKELEATVTKLKETSKEIDIWNIRNFQKSSTSLPTLPSKSEKSLPRTFASQRNSDSLVLSSRQRAKLYAVSRQRRIRKERQTHQQITDKEDGSYSVQLKRQYHLEEESTLFQARQRKRLSSEDELDMTQQLEIRERTEKDEEKMTQWMERQHQLEGARKSVGVESKDHLKELRNVVIDEDDYDEEEDKQWSKSEDAQCSSVDEDIDQRLLDLNDRRPKERQRCVENRFSLKEDSKTEERSRLEERKRSREDDTEGKRLEEGEVENRCHLFKDRSRTQLEERRLAERHLLLIEETAEDNEEHDSRQMQLIERPIEPLLVDHSIKAFSVDPPTQGADVATKGKWMKSRKEYVFTRSTVHLHQGHPTRRMKLVPWAQGNRHRIEIPRNDSP